MGGGLMQLVAYGAQDVYLTGNPQITFFKVVYRRHTNFAIESVELGFNSTGGFGKKASCTISRNGDLVSNMVLRIKIDKADGGNNNWAWSNFLGHRIINYVDIQIGGTRIDRQYGEWLHLWNQLTLPEAKVKGYNNLIGHKLGVIGQRGTTNNNQNGDDVAGKIVPLRGAGEDLVLNIPLQFWFCRNPGLALPLIALQYHDVKVEVELNTLASCIKQYNNPPSNTNDHVTFNNPEQWTSSGGAVSAIDLFVDYIYLDTDERRRFAQLTHEYLIEQVQRNTESFSNQTVKMNLPFNHPIKELVWVIQADSKVVEPPTGTIVDKDYEGGEYFNYVTNTTTSLDAVSHRSANPLNPGGEGDITLVGGNQDLVNYCESAQIKLNGQDRFSERSGEYFNIIQPYQHHTRIPHNGINCYSFALRPEEHQPSGTCNFSRLDSAQLHLETRDAKSKTVRAYAVNYNVLRIMSGMGGLAYSN